MAKDDAPIRMATESFQEFRLDKVELKQSAASKAPSQVTPEPEISKGVAEDENRQDFLNSKNLFLIQLTRQLKKINENCELVAEKIFEDNNYIDPQYKLYKRPDQVIQKIDRVFHEMLLQNKSKQAFDLLKQDIERAGNEGVAPQTWTEALRHIDVCRENEVFYFFETMFESLRYKQVKAAERRKVITHFLGKVKLLLAQQQTMSNLLFVTNLVIKSTKLLPVEDYIKGEAKRLFDDLIDYWRVNTHYYQENRGSKQKQEASTLEVDFYRDYFRQTEYYHQELNKLLEEVLL